MFSILASVGLRAWVVRPLVVQGRSMSPTFGEGAWVLVEELTPRFVPLRRGEVVVIRDPQRGGNRLLKRIIGLPGETVTAEHGVVSILSDHDEPTALEEPYARRRGDDSFGRTLGPGEYFVLGDNRRSSLDSRTFGPVSLDRVEGRLLCVIGSIPRWLRFWRL